MSGKHIKISRNPADGLDLALVKQHFLGYFLYG
jgi:hypothetical protein